MNNNLLLFPSQKKSFNEKTEDWAKKCVDAAENISTFKNYRVRESQYNKQVNYNLANDILDTRDMEKVINPLGLTNAVFPATMQNYPIANPKIDLLTGEESKRRFDWFLRVTNDDAITMKEEDRKNKIFQFVQQEITDKSLNEDQLQKRLKDFNKYLNYEFQDMKELTGTRILKYLYKQQELPLKFNAGFQDSLIAGEEIYIADIIGGEPILRRGNPLNIYTIRSGDSNRIEDSDIIVEEVYMSPGQIVDKYYDHLTSAQIDDIEAGRAANTAAYTVLNHKAMNTDFRIEDFTLEGNKSGSNNLINVGGTAGRYFGGAYDSEGNLRVVRVLWKSRKKIGKLKYIDQDGQEQEDIVDDVYKPNKDSGETIEWLWVNEWWEGTKIGQDMYLKMQPRPIQFRKMDNLSYCNPGIVGTFFNINDSKAKSLMDRMKPYQYLYNIFMYRTEIAFAKSKGKIAELDVSKIPDDWDLNKWMYYAEVMGWAAVDPFNEGKKGQAKGKLSGSFNTTGKVLDMEMGSYINQHIQMLQYIEVQLGKIAGVTDQRQGEISSSELVGNVNRAVTQSSHITEKWFMIHDNTKLRAMEILLETAKHAWKGKSKKLQYVLDDMSSAILEVDGDEFMESEYGLFLSNSSNDSELMGALKELAHAGIQNDKVNFSNLIDIYHSDSIVQIRRKLEAAEESKMQQQQEMQKMQQDSQERMAQMQKESTEDQQAHEMEKAKLASETSIRVAEIGAETTVNNTLMNQAHEIDLDLNDDGVEDASKLEIELKKLEVQKEKNNKDYELAKQKLTQEGVNKKKELELKKEEISVKRIAANKKSTTK